MAQAPPPARAGLTLVSPQARYKQSLDPTVDEVKKLCTSLRRNAKEERVLFHYNGHGVPRPTVNGEIWVFNKVRAARPAPPGGFLLLRCAGATPGRPRRPPPAVPSVLVRLGLWRADDTARPPGFQVPGRNGLGSQNLGRFFAVAPQGPAVVLGRPGPRLVGRRLSASFGGGARGVAVAPRPPVRGCVWGGAGLCASASCPRWRRGLVGARVR